MHTSMSRRNQPLPWPRQSIFFPPSNHTAQETRKAPASPPLCLSYCHCQPSRLYTPCSGISFHSRILLPEEPSCDTFLPQILKRRPLHQADAGTDTAKQRAGAENNGQFLSYTPAFFFPAFLRLLHTGPFSVLTSQAFLRLSSFILFFCILIILLQKKGSVHNSPSSLFNSAVRDIYYYLRFCYHYYYYRYSHTPE